MAAIRVLLFADTHVGFDLAVRPRVARRRRGEDFLANYRRALEPARSGEVDVVVHGGDVFDRPGVDPLVARRGLEPLLEVLDAGVPVFVVPGNHERARLPSCFLGRRGIQVFDRARTFRIEVHGRRVAVAGFPYERRVRERFGRVLARAGWDVEPADARLLCIHHCVEGAQVGPGDFTFTRAPDVIRGRDIPPGLSAVLSGHIHRRQVLTTDLAGRPLAAPVLYPGSVERTSTAEIGEEKGYLVIEIDDAGTVRWEPKPLPARPMLVRELDVRAASAEQVEARLRALIAAAPADAVLRIRLNGDPPPEAQAVLTAAHIRAIAPPTMNAEVHPRIPPAVWSAAAARPTTQLRLL